MKKKVISYALILAMAVTAMALPNWTRTSKEARQSQAASSHDYDVLGMKRDTQVEVSSGGDINIERNEAGDTSMGVEDSWTIMIYMDGTDLETCYGSATKDLKEIMSAKLESSTVENVNILVQTGGTSWWHYQQLDASKTQRMKFESISGPTILEELEPQDMASADTLYDFLEWGVENYPAENMGVVFWNHGGGVSEGVCNEKQDSLMVPELEYAFSKASKKMTDKFKFIGFDTCLSGSLEYAHTLAPYADYMIASANTEPGEGWCYQEVIDAVVLNHAITVEELGKVICDSYYNTMSRKYKSDRITMDMYDLSEVDDVCIEFNRLAKDMDESAKSDSSFLEKMNEMHTSKKAVAYGQENRNLDIGTLIRYMDKEFRYDTSGLQTALDKFIVYKCVSDTIDKYDGVGLSIYYPMDALKVAEFAVLRNVVFSPYYLNYLEKMSYYRLGRSEVNFHGNSWETSKCFYEENFDFLNVYTSLKSDDSSIKALLSSCSEYIADGFIDRWISNFGNGQSGNRRDDPFNPFGSRYMVTKENTEYDRFILPDGQDLTVYVEESLGEVIYSIPVVIKDIDMTVKILQIEENGKKEYHMLGVWDATYDSNYEGRGYLPLETGTTIIPIYDFYDEELGEFYSEYGEEYVIQSEFDFLLAE